MSSIILEIMIIISKKNTSGNETLTLEKKNTEESISKLDWKRQKEQLAQVRKLENEFKRVEETISKLEERSGVPGLWNGSYPALSMSLYSNHFCLKKNLFKRVRGTLSQMGRAIWTIVLIIRFEIKITIQLFCFDNIDKNIFICIF